MMESELRQYRQQQTSSGVSRYRSAPSTYFSQFDVRSGMETVDYEPYPGVRSTESERTVCRFTSEETSDYDLEMASREDGIHGPNSYASSSQVYYAGNGRSHLQTQNPSSPLTEIELSYGGVLAFPSHVKATDRDSSNLIHNSISPAALFTDPDVHKGYGTTGAASEGEPAFPPARRSGGQISFSSGPPSCSSNSNIGRKSTRQSNAEGRRTYQRFPMASWEEEEDPPEDFSCMEREKDDKETQLLESGSGNGGSVHGFLPLMETVTIERYSQFQDSVPCKVRAKRGCATHPRSIAERVRRTRISERMRKLQELVPNMDKQTSTADMLELAVDYIKDLQKQVELLMDTNAKCTCSDPSKP